MQKIIVAAKSDNQIIGKNNGLVWHLPADLQFFMQTIEDACLVTGRKSFESAQGEEIFGDNRQFIIITRNRSYQSNKGKIAHSIENAIGIAQKNGVKRLCILGGAAIYEQSMDIADKMILTEVHETFEGDAVFPKIDLNRWEEISRVRFSKDKENPYDYSFVVYTVK